MSKPNEYIDPYCDICVKKGFLKAAAGFCPKCSEFVCYHCLNIHGQDSSTERHKLLFGVSMPARQSEKPLKYPSCTKHYAEIKENYCIDHGLIVCDKCSAEDHKNCDIKSILVAYKSFNISAEDTAFKGTASHFLGHAQQVQSSVEENLNELEKQRDNLIKESHEFREQTIKQINQTCDDFEKHVLKTFEEQADVLTEQRATIAKVVSEIEGTLEGLQRQGMKTLGEARYFLHLKTHAEAMVDYSEKLQKIYSSLRYVDLTGQFYLCINPITDRKSEFVHIELDVPKYDYDKTVPDLHIPCKREHPDNGRPRASSSTSAQSSSSDRNDQKVIQMIPEE